MKRANQTPGPRRAIHSPSGGGGNSSNRDGNQESPFNIGQSQFNTYPRGILTDNQSMPQAPQQASQQAPQQYQQYQPPPQQPYPLPPQQPYQPLPQQNQPNLQYQQFNQQNLQNQPLPQQPYQQFNQPPPQQPYQQFNQQAPQQPYPLPPQQPYPLPPQQNQPNLQYQQFNQQNLQNQPLPQQFNQQYQPPPQQPYPLPLSQQPYQQNQPLSQQPYQQNQPLSQQPYQQNQPLSQQPYQQFNQQAPQQPYPLPLSQQFNQQAPQPPPQNFDARDRTRQIQFVKGSKYSEPQHNTDADGGTNDDNVPRQLDFSTLTTLTPQQARSEQRSPQQTTEKSDDTIISADRQSNERSNDDSFISVNGDNGDESNSNDGDTNILDGQDDAQDSDDDGEAHFSDGQDDEQVSDNRAEVPNNLQNRNKTDSVGSDGVSSNFIDQAKEILGNPNYQKNKSKPIMEWLESIGANPVLQECRKRKEKDNSVQSLLTFMIKFVKWNKNYVGPKWDVVLKAYLCNQGVEVPDDFSFSCQESKDRELYPVYQAVQGSLATTYKKLVRDKYKTEEKRNLYNTIERIAKIVQLQMGSSLNFDSNSMPQDLISEPISESTNTGILQSCVELIMTFHKGNLKEHSNNLLLASVIAKLPGDICNKFKLQDTSSEKGSTAASSCDQAQSLDADAVTTSSPDAPRSGNPNQQKENISTKKRKTLHKSSSSNLITALGDSCQNQTQYKKTNIDI